MSVECKHKWSEDDCHTDTVPMTVGNRTFIADIPAFVCVEGCGDIGYKHETLELLELAVASRLLKDDALTGDGMKFCRKSAGMSRNRLMGHIAVSGTAYTVEQLKEMEDGKRAVTPEVVDILKIAVAAAAAEATMTTGRALPTIR